MLYITFQMSSSKMREAFFCICCMSRSHSFSNAQPCKYFGRHLFFPPQPQTSLEIGWSQWHDCGYRWKIVTSDSLAVKWHIYLCLLHTVNWKFHVREGVSSISSLHECSVWHKTKTHHQSTLKNQLRALLHFFPKPRDKCSVDK